MKHKVQEKVNVITFPMYSYEVNVIITENLNKSRRNRNKELGKVEKDFSASGLFSYVNNYEGHIFLPVDTSIEVLTHECFHAIVHMIDGIDTELSEATEECYAYPLGYLTEKVYNFLKLVKPEFKIKKNDKVKSKRPS